MKGGSILASTATQADFVDAVASEIALGVDRAVEYWMSQIEQALTDVHLTSLGRLNAVQELLEEYKRLTGKAHCKAERIC
jgi:acetyl-CoA carboxylase alpha subunit